MSTTVTEMMLTCIRIQIYSLIAHCHLCISYYFKMKSEPKIILHITHLIYLKHLQEVFFFVEKLTKWYLF